MTDTKQSISKTYIEVGTKTSHKLRERSLLLEKYNACGTDFTMKGTETIRKNMKVTELKKRGMQQEEIILKKNALAACKSTLQTANTRMIM